jgi:hypothetical protein
MVANEGSVIGEGKYHRLISPNLLLPAHDCGPCCAARQLGRNDEAAKLFSMACAKFIE